MPIVAEEIGQRTFIQEEDIETEAPSISETFGAAFRTENSLVSAAANGFGIRPDFQPEEGYDPFDGDINGYELFSESFIDSKSPGESFLIKSLLDRELEDRKTLASSGGAGFVAQMAAGITDPIYLPLMLTGLGQIKAGASAAKAFGTTASISAVGEIAAEAAKHSSQEARTLTESAINVGGAALLSGLLGAAFNKLTKAEFNSLSVKAEEILSEEPNLSMGAAAVVKNSMEDLELVNAGTIEQWGVSPLVRTQTSPEKQVREIASAMFESPLLQKGNIKGKTSVPEGGSVETRKKRWQAGMVEALEDMDNLYLKYRTGTAPSGIVSGSAKSAKIIINDYMLRNRQNKLSASEFRVKIGRALRRNDVDDIPEVAQAAKSFRAKIINPLRDAAIEGKLLPKDVEVTTAASYLTRIYNTKKITGKRGEWDNILDTWIRSTDDKLSAIEVREVSDSITDNIMGNSSGRIPYDAVAIQRGPLKERTFNIPDQLIEDFLESDIDLVIRQYVRTMAPDVELNRVFGDVTLKSQFKEITDSYTIKIQKATTEKAKFKLEKRMKQDINDLEAARDMLRGTYRMPDNPNNFFIRAGRIIRDVNFLRLLGGMTISAIPDLARPIAINGFRPFFRSIKALAFAPKQFKMARLEAKKAAVGLDMVLNSRAASLAELGDIYASGTPFERGLRTTSDAFGKITLMAPWNASMKQFAGVMTQDRLIGESIKWAKGTISKNSLKRMALAGIDQPMAKRIAQQFEKHGDDGTIRLSNGQNWDDIGALETLRSSVLKDVDRAIITPGIGEKPLWTSSETGKLIFQFKTFAASAHHKILLADLQHRDLQALSGYVMAVGLGTLAYSLKQLNAGREVSTDPAKLLIESMDRSGTMGYFWDANNMLEKFTRGNIGVNPAIGAPPMSRYASRDIWGAVLGPSIGTVSEVFNIGGGVADEFLGDDPDKGFTKRELRSVRRLMPAQNLFYMRQLLDQLEQKIGAELE